MSIQGDSQDRLSESADWPAPLREGNDDVALLLRCESVRRLEPGRPFFTVKQKRAQRQWRNISLAAFVGIFGATLWLGGAIETQTSAIVAEPLLSIPKSVIGPGHQAKSAELDAKPVAEFTIPASKKREAPLQELLVLPSENRANDPALVKERQLPVLKVAVAPPNAQRGGLETPVREDCALLSRSGHYDKAMQCFRLKSQGEGTSAEIGFLEMARIQRRVLDDNSAALETLARYQEKFPQGTLSWEADQLRQELLRKERASVLVAE